MNNKQGEYVAVKSYLKRYGISPITEIEGTTYEGYLYHIMEEYHQYATQIDADKLAGVILEGLLEDIKGMHPLYIIDYIKEQVDIVKH